MRNHYDMRGEVLEAVRNLIFSAAHDGGDTAGAKACKPIVDDSKRHFSKGEFEDLKEVAEHVARLQALNALYDVEQRGCQIGLLLHNYLSFS